MSAIAFPHARITAASIHSTSWEVRSSDGQVLGGARAFSGWDYGIDLSIEREFRLDFDAASRDLGYGSDDAAFDLVVSVGTGQGAFARSRRIVAMQRLERGRATATVRVNLDGASLSGRLRVESQIILAHSAHDRSTISPVRLGARLWSDLSDVTLEGDDARFPMEAASFSALFPGMGREGALWFVHWSPAMLHADFMGAVRLYVNTDQVEFIDRFRQGDALVLQMVMAGVMSEMLATLLDLDDADAILQDAEPDTVAGQLASWLELALPGQNVATAREKLKHRPGDFHAAIQAAARMERS